MAIIQPVLLLLFGGLCLYFLATPSRSRKERFDRAMIKQLGQDMFEFWRDRQYINGNTKYWL